MTKAQKNTTEGMGGKSPFLNDGNPDCRECPPVMKSAELTSSFTVQAECNISQLDSFILFLTFRRHI